MSRPGLFIAAIALFTLASSPLGATDAPVFQDDFEATPLSGWTSKSGAAPRAAIADDPLRPRNHVLAFTALDADSDTFSPTIAVTRGASYVLHFEYLGRNDLPPAAGQEVELGGTIGFTEDPSHAPRWLAGSAAGMSGIPAMPRLVDDGGWHTYDIVFDPYVTSAPTGDAIRLVLERMVISQAVPGDPFFDNIQVTRQATPPGDGGCAVGGRDPQGLFVVLLALAARRRFT